MTYAIPAPTIPTLPIEGTEAVFPVHRIYCVGRNYAAHAIEMGHDPDREPPFFFQKNPDSLVLSGADFPYPGASNDVHFEIELVVALGSGGTDIPVESALEVVVAPLLEQGHKVLALVLDGLSWGIAHELLEDCRRQLGLEAFTEAGPGDAAPGGY